MNRELRSEELQLKRRLAKIRLERAKRSKKNEPLILIGEEGGPDVGMVRGGTAYAHPSCVPWDECDWKQLGEFEARRHNRASLVGGYNCLFCGKGDLTASQPGEAQALREAAKAELIRHLERRAEQAKKDRLVFTPLTTLFAIIGVIAVVVLVLYNFGPQQEPTQPTQVSPPPAPVTTTPTCQNFPHRDGCTWPDGPLPVPPATTTPPLKPPYCQWPDECYREIPSVPGFTPTTPPHPTTPPLAPVHECILEEGCYRGVPVDLTGFIAAMNQNGFGVTDEAATVESGARACDLTDKRSDEQVARDMYDQSPGVFADLDRARVALSIIERYLCPTSPTPRREDG